MPKFVKPKDPKLLLKRLTVIISVFLVIGALIAGIWLIYFSPYLVVRNVVVTGNSLLPASTIKNSAGIRLDQPLATLDIGAIAGRVAKLPPVDSVTISRHWPNTVEIKIVERKELLAVLVDKQYVIVDAKGVAFNKVAKPAKGVLVAELKNPNSAIIRSVARSYAALPTDIKNMVTKVTADNIDAITFTLKDKSQVFWGSDEKNSEKAEVLKLLYKVKAKVYDVSAPSHPATR